MKYKFTGEKKEYLGRTLNRIVCVTAFGSVSAGDIGGWIERESNLSQEGNAWVSGNAWVYGDARVSGDAEVYDNARVSGDAEVYDNARVYGDARVYDNARVSGDAEVYDNARVSGDARVYDNAWISDNAWVSGNARVKEVKDYVVLKNNWSSYRYFTYTLSNNKWRVGCFYGTGDELIAKAYKDSELSGDCYKAAVEYVEKIKDAMKKVEESK